ncbi:MAG TPA: hypothetical protein PL091_09985 [Actinomycetota bacterium]|nr:hypothetical protein [Actinomycetota bacterium]
MEGGEGPPLEDEVELRGEGEVAPVVAGPTAGAEGRGKPATDPEGVVELEDGARGDSGPRHAQLPVGTADAYAEGGGGEEDGQGEESAQCHQ